MTGRVARIECSEHGGAARPVGAATGPVGCMNPGGTEYRLDGRVVIVTGASSGIGRWLVGGLHAAGAHVVATARSADALAEVVDGLRNGLAVTGDVTLEEDRASMVAAALERFGRLDGLVNNAGIAHFGRALDETAEDVRRQLEVNVVAPFDLARRCALHMRAAAGGSIVNITSMSASVTTGVTVPSAGYCASKAALAHMTRELAVQWGRYGIRVNSVAPGMFPTGMTDHAEDLPDFFADRLVLKRLGRPADLIAAVQYLLSDASDYVTGQQLTVDGGRTIT